MNQGGENEGNESISVRRRKESVSGSEARKKKTEEWNHSREVGPRNGATMLIFTYQVIHNLILRGLLILLHCSVRL